MSTNLDILNYAFIQQFCVKIDQLLHLRERCHGWCSMRACSFGAQNWWEREYFFMCCITEQQQYIALRPGEAKNSYC